MKIIIEGCGKVGSKLLEQLTAEGHEVTLIEINSKTLASAVESYDIFGVCGNGVSYSTQLEAGIENSDLFIAVTDNDETNLLSCLIARKAGHCRTIARVRKPEFYYEIGYIREELGLAMSINPDMAAASEIARLIHFPSAIEADTFAKGKVNLIKVKIPDNSVLDGMSLKEFSAKISRDVLICMVERNHDVTIPSGDFILNKGDYIYFIIPLEQVSYFFSKIGIKTKPIKNVIIAGGGTISYYLAKKLPKNINVKIIEKDLKRCEWLSESLPSAFIINGDATDKQLLHEEGIQTADAFISATGIDEENVMLSLYAETVSKAKRMIKLTRCSFGDVLDNLSVGSIIRPNNISAEYILRFVRSMQNSIDTEVQALYRMVDERVEASEFLVGAKCKIINKPLTTLNFKKNLLLCCISRNGKIITPSGKDVILPNDIVIVVTTNKGLTNIDDILA